MKNLPEYPVEVSKQVLSRPNNIQLFPFMCLYMVPVYEKLTGNQNTMKDLNRKFRALYKKHYGNKGT
jgi:hypothetical protein